MKKILLSVFALSILLPTLAFASFDTSLKYGSRGDAVLELQDLLVAQGFLKGKVDGRYGLVTVNAVKAFQTANGLSSDGYFGKASRAKVSLILADQLQSSDTAEQTDTGTVATTSIVSGCTSTSAYSPTTGQPCNSTTQPTTPNLPAGCTSTFGYSITTGQACNGIASTVQQLQQTVQQQAQTIQQIQQNTQQLVQNTTPIPPAPVVHDLPKVLGYEWRYKEDGTQRFDRNGDTRNSPDNSCGSNSITIKTDVSTTATLQLLERIMPENLIGGGDGWTAILNQPSNLAKVKSINNSNLSQFHYFCYADLGLEVGKDYVFSFFVTDTYNQAVQQYMNTGKQFNSQIYINL
ncbi:MAG: peptidoglycan-binding domain-containing protein [Patescibacteria group bacterium]